MPKWVPYIVKDHKNITHVYDPIYRKNFYICCGISSGKFVDTINKTLGISLERPSGLGAFRIIGTNGMTVGLIWSLDRGETLRHELLHASIWTLRGVGIEINEHTEEALTYHTDFLYRCVTRK